MFISIVNINLSAIEAIADTARPFNFLLRYTHRLPHIPNGGETQKTL